MRRYKNIFENNSHVSELEVENLAAEKGSFIHEEFTRSGANREVNCEPKLKKALAKSVRLAVFGADLMDAIISDLLRMLVKEKLARFVAARKGMWEDLGASFPPSLVR